MAKLLAVTIIVIAIMSAIPVVMHTWEAPADISTHGQMIDDQMADTMVEAGVSFLAAQILLAIFIWRFSKPRPDGKLKTLPGGAKGLVMAAIVLVGAEVLALGAFGAKAWAQVYFTPPSADAMPIQVQAGQFAFYFRYPGPDGKFGPLHPEMISEANQNLFGLDPEHDVESRDDIVTAEMAIPVNKEIHLLMHAKDVSHSFYVPALRIHQDFVPGLDLSMHFTATKVGKYEIVCSQLCGLGHYNMRAYLEVMSPQDFEDWQKQQAAAQ
ncbi:MAG: cytochrome c oxidase subunit II [Candidatus Acidiferrum sp.]